jgi:flavorubredoxin
LARAIVKVLVTAGIEVKLFDIAQSDTSEIIKEMLDAQCYLFGSSTHDNDMLPTLAGFMEFFKGLKPKNRLAAVFGSYGWAGGATKEIEGVLQQAGIALAQPSFSVQYVPSEQELNATVAWAQAFAKIIQAK